jgi:hypothetical protein
MGDGQRPGERITEEVISWPGVTGGPGRRGEFSFKVGGPVFPGRPGFGARRIKIEADVEDVIALMRMNYERVVAKHGLPEHAAV